MGNQVIQPSLTGGELAPALHGRIDLARYGNSLKTCRNFLVSPYGGVKNRPGTQFVGSVKNHSQRARLIPFSYSTTQTYVLEFGAYYIRIYAAGVQQTYQWPGPDAWLTATPYSIGDYVASGGSYYYCKVGHSSGTFATDLASGYWLPLEMSVPGSVGILEIPTPYPASALAALKYTQSADVLTVVHPSYPPMQLLRYSDVKWVFAEQTLISGPFQDINTNKEIAVYSSANVGAVTLTSSKALFSPSNVGQLFYIEQKDFGKAWEPGKGVAIGDIRRAHGQYYRASTAGTTGQNIPTGTDDHWDDGGVDWSYLHSGYGVAKITAYTDSKTVSADVKSRLPDGSASAGYGVSKTVTASVKSSEGFINGTATAHGLTIGSYGTCLAVGDLYIPPPFGYTTAYPEFACGYVVSDANTILFQTPYDIGGGNILTITGFKPPVSAANSASYKWAFGSFGNPAIGGPGYPSAVTYYQQRLCFAGTPLEPANVWMSRTNSYSDFSRSNPIQDDDAISFTVAGNQVNAIKSMLQLDKMILMTQGAIWATGTGQSTDVLTPSNITIRMQGYRGVSDLPPIGIGASVLYVQDKGQVVRDLAYQFATDNYTGQDMTAMAAHLLDGHTITEWTWQQSPHNCAWMVREDGVLLGLTYLREQEVMAWHRHDTDGSFESVVSVSEGAEDALYVIVKRTVGGATKRFVERMATRVITDVRESFFVDSGLSFNGLYNPAGVTITLTGGANWNETDAAITVTASVGISLMFAGASDVGDQLVFTDADGRKIRLTITASASGDVATGVLSGTLAVGSRGVPISGWAWARDRFTGLNHLEGKTVSVLADGSVQSQKVVSGGAITISPPAVRVHAGLPIQADLETLDLSVPGIETLLPKHKSVPAVTFLVHESRSIMVGRDFDHLVASKIERIDYDSPINIETGKAQVRVPTTWSKGGQVCLRVNDPLPVGILAIIPEVIQGAS